MQILRGNLRLFGAGHVLHAGLLDVLHRLRHLVHAHHLLLARRRDLGRRLRRFRDAVGQQADRFAGLRCLFNPGLHRLAALFGGQHRRTGRFLDVAEDRAHLGGRLLGLLRQALYLLRDDREALALFARLVRFDRGIHREQVGLLGQVVDRGDDLADRLALLGQPHDALGDGFHLFLDALHALSRFFYRFAPALRNLRGLLCAVGNGSRLLARHLRRLLHFFHRGGGLAHRRRGLRRTGGYLRRGCEDLGGGGG